MREQKVLLDSDLAGLYGVSTRRFNEQVRRNRERFPADFMFQLSTEEWDSLRSQIATLKAGRGQHRKYLPYAFTEHGAIMAATILNSPRAIEVAVFVVRAFVRLREMLASNKELAKRLAQLEKKLGTHDQAIAGLISAIRDLMSPPEPAKKRKIGFVQNDWAVPSRASGKKSGSENHLAGLPPPCGGGDKVSLPTCFNPNGGRDGKV